MPLLVRKNVRALGQRELIGPILTVERIELVRYSDRASRDHAYEHEYEIFHLEDGSCRRPDELILVEMEEGLLLAMRMEAAIRAKDKYK